MTQAHRQQIWQEWKDGGEELRTLAFAYRPYQEGEPENMAETNPDFSWNNRYGDPIRPEGNPCGGGFFEGGRQHGYDHRRPL